MLIDVKTLTCTNLQLSTWDFNYMCSYDQSWLALHLARIDKVIQNLWHFFQNFRHLL